MGRRGRLVRWAAGTILDSTVALGLPAHAGSAPTPPVGAAVVTGSYDVGGGTAPCTVPPLQVSFSVDSLRIVGALPGTLHTAAVLDVGQLAGPGYCDGPGSTDPPNPLPYFLGEFYSTGAPVTGTAAHQPVAGTCWGEFGAYGDFTLTGLGKPGTRGVTEPGLNLVCTVQVGSEPAVTFTVAGTGGAVPGGWRSRFTLPATLTQQ